MSRACASQAHPGRLGSPSGPYYGGSALSGWTGWRKAGEIPPEWSPQGAHVPARKHGPLALNPAVARPQAPRSIARWTAPKPTIPAPAGAPLPSWVRGENCSHLGRITRRENAEAWLFDI